MVKVQAPLFSLDAQGSLGDAITYKKKGETNYVSAKKCASKRCVIIWLPQNKYHFHTVETWHEIGDYWRGVWGRWARWNMPVWSGFNCFYHHYMIALGLGQIPTIWPPH